jgi:transposase
MRGADTFTESLFKMRKLEGFVPAVHPLCAIRVLVNAVLLNLGPLLRGMYEVESTGGRPSIAPEKLLRAMLLHVLYGVGSERQSMEQMQFNLLSRWFIGLAKDDAVWVPTVFTKNRERLIKHDVVIKFFNEVVAIAQERDLLSGEHFSVDGTLIQSWGGHKSNVPKDEDRAGGAAGNLEGEGPSNDPHESKTDADALYRKGNTASEPRSLGHTLSDNRHVLFGGVSVIESEEFSVDVYGANLQTTKERGIAWVPKTSIHNGNRSSGWIQRSGTAWQRRLSQDRGKQAKRYLVAGMPLVFGSMVQALAYRYPQHTY